MLASFYLLSEGWATATYSPFYILTLTVTFFLMLTNFTAKISFACLLHVFLLLFVKSFIVFLIFSPSVVNLTGIYLGKIEMNLRFRQNKFWDWSKWYFLLLLVSYQPLGEWLRDVFQSRWLHSFNLQLVYFLWFQNQVLCACLII